MPRYRNIHSDISNDPRVAGLFEYGPWPALLYTWAVLHADDWGRMTGEARQFKLMVCPGADITAADVETALQQIASAGLWERYQIDGRQYIAFPFGAWVRHQSYINRKKLTRDGSKIPAPPGFEPLPEPETASKPPASGNAAAKAPAKDPQESAAVSGSERQSAAVSGPSPSPSPTPSPAAKAAAAATAAERVAATESTAAYAGTGYRAANPATATVAAAAAAAAGDFLAMILEKCDAGDLVGLTGLLQEPYPESAPVFGEFWERLRAKQQKADHNPAGYVRAFVAQHVRRYPPQSPAWKEAIEGVDGHEFSDSAAMGSGGSGGASVAGESRFGTSGGNSAGFSEPPRLPTPPVLKISPEMVRANQERLRRRNEIAAANSSLSKMENAESVVRGYVQNLTAEPGEAL